MTEWFKQLFDGNAIAVTAILVFVIGCVIKYCFDRNKNASKQKIQPSSPARGNGNAAAITIPGGSKTVTQNITYGLTPENYKQYLDKKGNEICDLLINKALSERDKQDLNMQLAEIEKCLNDLDGNYKAKIKHRDKQIQELTLQKGITFNQLLDEAITALKDGNEDKADAIFAKVEEAGQQKGIHTVAEAAYQRALIAHDKVECRLALQHAERAAQLMPEIGRYANFVGHTASTLGEYDKAIGYYEQALTSFTSDLGVTHPHTIGVRNNLDVVIRLQKERNEQHGL